MRDIEAGLIDVVVTYKIDRVSRSIRDFLDLYETFKRRNVQFVSVNESFDTTTSIGRAMLKLVLVFAELEREQTAKRTQATREYRARQGLWNGGTDCDAKYIPAEAEEYVLGELGKMALSPEEIEQVVRDANAQRVLGTMRRSWPNGGGMGPRPWVTPKRSSFSTPAASPRRGPPPAAWPGSIVAVETSRVLTTNGDSRRRHRLPRRANGSRCCQNAPLTRRG